jgi:hypothetical protein
MRKLLSVVAVSMAAAGCATIQDTPQQKLVQHWWTECKQPQVDLQEIRPDGSYTMVILGGYGANAATAKECMDKKVAEYTDEQRRQRSSGRANPTGPSVACPPNTSWNGFGCTSSPAQGRAVAVVASPSDSWDVPVWHRGDQWTYRWESPRGQGTFLWSYDRTESVDGTEYYVIKSGEHREIYRRKADLAYLMDTVDGEVVTRHRAPSQYVSWPVTPGHVTEYTTTVERPKSLETNELRITCEVLAHENVVVPAGEFMAAHVACRNMRTGNVTYELWYAPRVKHWVRERRTFDYGVQERELIGYHVE